MTAVTHPLARTNELVAVLITAAVSVGLTIALMLAFATTGGGTRVSHPAAARTPTVIGSGLIGTVNSGPDNPSQVSSSISSQSSSGAEVCRVGRPC
jgi:hypothetical protein